MTRRSGFSAFKFASVALFAIPVLFLGTACNPECVDKFDCKALEGRPENVSANKKFTCEASKCVECPKAGCPGTGTGGGAGGGEGGGAGGGTAGGAGGGTAGGAGGGTAGGAGGGTAGGAGGGTAGGAGGGGGLINPDGGSCVQAPVVLGTAANYGVLAGSTVTNVGPTSIVGSLGVSPGTAITGFPPGQVSGTIDANNSAAMAAHASVGTAYGDAAGRPVGCAVTVSGNIGGTTLTPGLYRSTSTLALSSGDLTLDGQNNANAVFIFQVASALTVTSGRAITLINGANPANVFWQIGTSATFGTTSSFVGTVIADQSITFQTGASLRGRALANNAAVTMDTNAVVNPTGPQFDYSGTFEAKLTADQSVPPTASAATGTVTVVSVNQNDGGYQVTVAGVLTGFATTETASAVHIHNKHAGLNGGILQGNLYSGASAAGTVTVSGTQPFSQASMTEIAAGRAYVNVHTSVHANGAIRGQILRAGEILWSAQLNGANSIPANPITETGGVGFIVSPDGGISYEGSWAATVIATAAHIHQGASTVNGAVVAPLTLVGTSALKGVLTIGQVDAGVDQYVNVHTADAGAGLIRGQIVRH